MSKETWTPERCREVGGAHSCTHDSALGTIGSHEPESSYVLGHLLGGGNRLGERLAVGHGEDA